MARGGRSQQWRGRLATAAVAAACLACLVAVAWQVLAEAGILPAARFAVLFAALAVVATAWAVRATLRARRAERRGRRVEALEDQVWEVSESLARHRDMLDAQGAVILRQDVAGRVTYANDAYCRTFAVAREAIDRALVAAPRGNGEAPVDTPSGRRWFAWEETVLRDEEGRAVETQTVGVDITEQKRIEGELRRARDAAEAASRAKSRFLAAVSHEIRTPMNGIVGMTDLLIDTELTAEQANYAQTVKRSARALLALIDDILDFSKIEAGRLDLAESAFSPAALAGEVAELLAPRAEEKGLEVGVFVARSVPASLVGDPDRLRQVLLNLAGNAVKFTEAGGVAIEMHAAADGDGRAALDVAVRDTGIGISAADLARIFDEFEQVDQEPSRRHGGTGLGLAISRRIVAAMGGELTARSRPGRGSVFRLRVTLPAEKQTSDAPPALAGRRVVVAAASTVLRRVLAVTLRDEGATVALAADAATLATRLAARRAPDAALVDLPLADAGLHPPPPCPAILLLPPSQRDVLSELGGRGFAGYLIKPVRRDSLLARLGAARGEAACAATGDAEPVAAAEDLPPLAVLLAEDNDVNAMLTTALLQRLGHRVTRVGDGAAALAALAEGTDGGFDLVLMDVRMPGLDGLAATRRLRAREKAAGAARLPVVALTANALAEDRGACLAAGMDGFLAKPVERRDLVACLAEHAGGYRRRA